MQPQGPVPYSGITFVQQHPVSRPYRGDCPTKSLKLTGIFQIILGGLVALLGMVAAGITAVFSYIAFAIWGGIFVFVTTGILGLVSYCKPTNRCVLISYIVTSIVSACLGFSMFVMYIVAAANEEKYYYDCHPVALRGYYYCNAPEWARKLIDSFIVIVAALEVASAIVAASMAGYKLCICCRRCCQDSSEQQNANVMYCAANGRAVPMIAVPSNQANRPIYVAGAGQQATNNQQGQRLVFAQPLGQFITAQPSGQPVVQMQTSHQGQQFIVAQPSGQVTSQPILQGQQFLVAQPVSQTVVQANNQQGQPFVVAQAPTQHSQPMATYHPSISQAAPGQGNMQQATGPVMAQMPVPGQPCVAGAVIQTPAMMQASDAAVVQTANVGHQGSVEVAAEEPSDGNLTLEANGQTSTDQYGDQKTLI